MHVITVSLAAVSVSAQIEDKERRPLKVDTDTIEVDEFLADYVNQIAAQFSQEDFGAYGEYENVDYEADYASYTGAVDAEVEIDVASAPAAAVKARPGAVGSPGHVTQCYKCSANSYTECVNDGTLEDCGPQEGNCFLREERQWNRGTRTLDVVRVQTGCMNAKACSDQQQQNFAFGATLSPMSKYNQCNSVGNFRHSSCYQCCDDKNNCVYENGVTSMWEPADNNDWDF